MPLFCDIAYKSSCNMLECRDQHFSIEGYSSNLVYDLNTCYIQIYLSQAYVSSKNNSVRNYNDESEYCVALHIYKIFN